MLKVEIRVPNKEKINDYMIFSPNLQIDVCIKNFLRKYPEFGLPKQMKYIYFKDILIDKSKFFKDYNFRNGDKITISSEKLSIPRKKKFSAPEIIIEDFIPESKEVVESEYKDKIINNIITVYNPKKNIEIYKKKYKIWIIIIPILVLLGLLSFSLWYFLKEKILPNEPTSTTIENPHSDHFTEPIVIKPEENLIIDIKYKVNETMFFINQRINNSTMIYNRKSENQVMEEFTNFSVTITDEFEIDNKKCYSAYLVILNMTSSNGTFSNLDASFDLFNSSQLRNLDEEEEEPIIDLSNKTFNDINMDKYLFNESFNMPDFNISQFSEEQIQDLIKSFKSQPIIKFIFFKNGKIKDIFLPKFLKPNIFYNAYDLIDKIIPKINNELFGFDYDTFWENQTIANNNRYKDDDLEEEEEEGYYEEDDEDIEEDEQEENNLGRNLDEIKKNDAGLHTYRTIDNNSEINSTTLLEIDKSSVSSGENMKLEGSSINSNVQRIYNNNSQRIENITYTGEASLVNELKNNDKNFNELLGEKLKVISWKMICHK